MAERPHLPRLEAKRFKNTFAPCINMDPISVGMVIAGLRHGTIKEESLPKEVDDAVYSELERMERETISTERALVLLLGAMGEVSGSTQLQKYAFLVDMGLYSKKTGDLFTLFGWKAGKLGPHSKILERRLRSAMQENLVETPNAHEPNAELLRYRLTDIGKERFQELQGAFGGDMPLIKGILAEFKGSPSVEALVAHVHNKYPEYTDKSATLEQIEVMR